MGINIDHVATLRNARGGNYPDPLRAAKIAVKSGANGITFHLREDRRHIRDDDIFKIKDSISAPINFEIAPRDEMLDIACKLKPNAVCLVPESRQELTTEGGLDICKNEKYLSNFIKVLKSFGIKVSLFIEADYQQVDAGLKVGADILEFHTGFYSCSLGLERQKELKKIQDLVEYASNLGLECHAGHGLTYDNVSDIASISNIVELNIGHFLVGESIFLGFDASINKMRYIIDQVRSNINK